MKLKVKASCNVCGDVYHEVDLEGERLSWFNDQLKKSGVAPVSWDHGDHILVVYVDKRGSARASYTYPVVKTRLTKQNWRRVKAKALVDSNVNMLFANWNNKLYCDSYWRLATEPEEVLPHADTARIASLDGREFWILSSGANRMIIARMLGWHRDFFQAMQELLTQATLAEPDIVGNPVVQAVLASIASTPFFYTSNSASVFSDLNKRVKATRAALLAKHSLNGELALLIDSLNSHGTLKDALLSATPRQISLLVKYYRTLKNTGVLKAV
nr:hypothetical protein [Candidatus Bathyarchaeota archaeon]